MTSKYEVASAHGRFQLLHYGHLEYLLAAKQRCEFLWIGITQVDLDDLRVVGQIAKHRADPKENPLTYFERESLIYESLLDAGLTASDFAVVPFPIETPEKLPQYLPLDVPILTTVYDEWNRAKIAILESAGYKVEVLWERAVKEFSGSLIRRMLATGDESYLALVPDSTVRFIRSNDIAERVRELRDDPERDWFGP